MYKKKSLKFFLDHCLEDPTCVSESDENSEDNKDIDAKVLRALKRLISKNRHNNGKYDENPKSENYYSKF